MISTISIQRLRSDAMFKTKRNISVRNKSQKQKVQVVIKMRGLGKGSCTIKEGSSFRWRAIFTIFFLNATTEQRLYFLTESPILAINKLLLKTLKHFCFHLFSSVLNCVCSQIYVCQSCLFLQLSTLIKCCCSTSNKLQAQKELQSL